MKTIKLLSIVTLLTLLVSCSEPPQGSQYFPLQKGLQWTYHISTEYPSEQSESELTISNIGKESYGDKSYFVRRTSSGTDYYHTHDQTGTYREGLRTIVELKPRLDKIPRYVLKAPLKIGTVWSEITQPMILLRLHPERERPGKDSKIPMTYKIESVSETLTVAAGTFENCIKVIAEGMTEIYTDPANGYSDIPFYIEEWYAPNVGLIKLVRSELHEEKVQVLDTPIYMGGTTVLELTKFTKN